MLPFDPADPAFLADPYPTFARLREQAPVHWHEGLGGYVAVSYAAADQLLRDRGLGRIWKDKEPVELFEAFNLLHRTSILESEPPTHTRLRRLVAGAFGRGHVERLRPWIGELAAGLVQDLRAAMADGGGSADLLPIVAEPLPVNVIAELLRVPEADRHLLRPWSNAIVKMYEHGATPQTQAVAEEASREFVAYLRALVAERRVTPLEGDLVSDLVAATGPEGGEKLSDDEVVGTCVLLLMAGHEATVNVVGNGTLALLEAPDQWRAVAADPALVPAAAEEMVRYDSALQQFDRTATRDVEIAGVRLEAGQKVSALLGAANRDPAVFVNPDRFDARRPAAANLGFGSGIHFCLGAPLARIEIQTALAALTSAFPDLTLAVEPARRPEFVIRGLERLEVSAGRRP